jgi:cytochrome c-type biogenesis protein
VLEELLGLFTLGIVTFLSPCSIALISVYLTYALGIGKNMRKGFIIGCCFTVAMCLVFFFLGYAVSSLIPINPESYQLFFAIAGILLIFFGLNNLGLFKKAKVSSAGDSLTGQVSVLKLNASMRLSKYNYAVGSFLFGIVISLALGPCSLALVLPAILLTIFSSPTPYHGGFLLFAFGLGHALPVIVLSTVLGTARKAVNQKISLAGEWLTKILGLGFVIIGVIMVVYGVVG